MLHGIREGVLGLDAQGRINVLNDEARRLLERPARPASGEHVAESLPAGRLRDVVDR